MIDIQSNVVLESGIKNFDVGILNIYHISACSIIYKKGIRDLLNRFCIILNIKSWSIICPILLKSAILTSYICIILYVDCCWLIGFVTKERCIS